MRTVFLRLSAYLVTIVLVAALIAGCVPSGTDLSSSSSEEKGADALGMFQAVDLDGNPIDYTVFYENKLTMVNIWATWCGPCVGEIPELGKLDRDYADRGFSVIGILADSVSTDGKLTQDKGSITNGKTIIKQSDADYPNLIPDAVLYDLITTLQYYPTTYFVDHTGKIVYEAVGSNDYDGWSVEIEKWLAEVE